MTLAERITDTYKAVVSPRTQRRIVQTRLRVRHATSPMRLLPHFLVIGAQRSGTSSLYRYLGAHPEIAASLRKEVGYFTRYYDRGPAWYRAHFPLAARKQLGRIRTFEATPDYLLDPRAPWRAAALLPEVKLIVLLRDPVERAWSHYQHMVRLGFEHLPFQDALAAEGERLADDLGLIEDNPSCDPKSFYRFSYVTRGHYVDQLDRWLNFYPRGRILVVRSESFYRDTSSRYAEILRFLGVSPWAPPSFRNYSAPGTSELDPALRQQLEEHFHPFNERLQQLLDNWDEARASEDHRRR